MDGGYAEYMVAYEDSLSSIPNELSVLEAASLMCAGETTFSALRNSKARPGDLVTIQGIGGVKVILATAPDSKAISSLINGLGSDSELVIVAVVFDNKLLSMI